MSRTKKRAIARNLTYVFLTVVFLIQMFPMACLLLNSFSTTKALRANVLDLSFQFYWQNYTHVWDSGNYSIAYINSIKIGVCTVIIVLVSNSLAAYALTKMNPIGRNFWVGYLFVAVSIPGFAFLVPVFFIFSRVGLINNLFGIILIISAMQIPFSLLLMRSFFIGIPTSLEDAARIDGCSELKTLIYIIAPLSVPILSTVALLSFVGAWNEFLFSNTFLQDNMLRTVSVRLYVFTGRYNSQIAYVYTAAMIAILPIILAYMLFQRTFIEGMIAGSIKG